MLARGGSVFQIDLCKEKYCVCFGGWLREEDDRDTRYSDDEKTRRQETLERRVNRPAFG